MLLNITLDSVTAKAHIDTQVAPQTWQALTTLLPYSGIGRYAKIAGEEFFVHIPLVVEVEQGQTVTDLPGGGIVVFWPERQLFCVYYGRIQEEDTQVTVLGQIVDNLAGLVEAGENLRRTQGHRYTAVHLSLPDQAVAEAESFLIPDLPLAARIMAAYLENTHQLPAAVKELLERRGIMRPAGALIYAEAETRKMQELLWVMRASLMRSGADEGMVVILYHFAQRLGGWYGLVEAARLTEEAAQALTSLSPDQSRQVLETLMSYIGQLNSWLDAYIPWNDFNDSLQGNYPRF